MAEDTLENVQITAKELAEDIAMFYSTENHHFLNRHAATLQRTVDIILTKHEIFFKSMIKRLEITEDNLSETFVNVVEKLLENGRLHWWRIVTIYAFSAQLVKFATKSKFRRNFIRAMADVSGDYVATSAGDWILRQGGWEAFEAYFEQPQNMEREMWWGLLFTALGLGALAAMLVAR